MAKTQRELQKIRAEDRKIAREEIQIQKQSAELLDKELRQTKDIASTIQSYIASKREASKLQEKINKQLKLESDLRGEADKNVGKELGHIGEIYSHEADIVKQNIKNLQLQQKQLQSQSLIVAVLGSTVSLMDQLTGINIKQELSAKNIVKWLIEQQKSLKQLNLQLGLSGEKAELMRKTISDTAFQTQVLGVGVKELTEIQAGLADETGRVRTMTVQSQTAIAEIAAGTKLGTQEAGKLAGQFQNIGIDAIKSNKIVQSIVDQSERMGIGTTKVLKSVIDNFKTAQKFYFKRGIQALAEMAAHAEKFKVDMTSTFETMTKAKTLEGSIEMAAQLRLAGSEFSKVDPLRLLFLARTDAAKFQETLQQMTKGVSIFNKETGQFDISAIDLDRLKIVADATGKSLEELSLTAKRTAEIEMARKQIPGFRGMNKELQESIEGMVEWNSQEKKFMIMGKDISKFNQEQLKSLKVEKESLEDRAKQAIAFDDAFKNLTNTIKSAFLPLIKGLNWITNIIQSATEGVSWLGKSLVMAFTIGIPALLMFGGKFISTFLTMKAMTLGLGKNIGNIAAITTKMPKGGIMGSLFGPKFNAGAMLKGAAAMVLVGASLIPFAYAMTLLKDVGWKQFGLIAAGIGLMTGAVLLLGTLTAGTWPVILAGAGAMVIMGASLIPFAYGMQMLGNVNWKQFDGVLGTLSSLSLGIVELGAASVFMLPAAIGLGLMTLPLMGIAGAFKDIKDSDIPNIGSGFKTISSSVNAIDSSKLEEIQKTAEALRNLSVTAGLFGGLGNLFQDGITVKFKDNQVALNVDVTSEIDGEVFARKTASKVMGVIEENSYYKTRA